MNSCILEMVVAWACTWMAIPEARHAHLSIPISPWNPPVLCAFYTTWASRLFLMEKSFFAQGQCRIIHMTAKTSNAHDLHRSNKHIDKKKPYLCINYYFFVLGFLQQQQLLERSKRSLWRSLQRLPDCKPVIYHLVLVSLLDLDKVSTSDR